jgi:hypothetical protein
LSDQNHAIRDEIAYLRNLAVEGRDGPLVGGSILLVGGLVFGLASLAVWFGLTHGLGWDSGIQLVWQVSGALFFVYLVVAKLRQRGAVRGPAARATALAWSGIGFAMFVIVFSLLVLMGRTHEPLIAAALPPVFLALYGAGWFVAAMATRIRWLQLVWIGSAVMALQTALWGTGPAQFLIYGASLLALVALPGLVLMLQARRAA